MWEREAPMYSSIALQGKGYLTLAQASDLLRSSVSVGKPVEQGTVHRGAAK